MKSDVQILPLDGFYLSVESGIIFMLRYRFTILMYLYWNYFPYDLGRTVPELGGYSWEDLGMQNPSSTSELINLR